MLCAFRLPVPAAITLCSAMLFSQAAESFGWDPSPLADPQQSMRCCPAQISPIHEHRDKATRGEPTMKFTEAVKQVCGVLQGRSLPCLRCDIAGHKPDTMSIWQPELLSPSLWGLFLLQA